MSASDRIVRPSLHAGPMVLPSAVSRIVAAMHGWLRHRAERRQLVGLNDDMLRDLGLSRGDVEREYARPFWSAVNYDALETTRRNSGPRLGHCAGRH